MKEIIKYIALPVLGVLFGWLLSTFNSALMPLILPIDKSILLYIAIVLFILLITAVIYIVYMHGQLNPKTYYELFEGFYWDKEYNPHCQTCLKPIQNLGKADSGNSKGHYSLLCGNCNRIYYPYLNGVEVDFATLKQAAIEHFETLEKEKNK